MKLRVALKVIRRRRLAFLRDHTLLRTAHKQSTVLKACTVLLRHDCDYTRPRDTWLRHSSSTR